MNSVNGSFKQAYKFKNNDNDATVFDPVQIFSSLARNHSHLKSCNLYRVFQRNCWHKNYNFSLLIHHLINNFLIFS